MLRRVTLFLIAISVFFPAASPLKGSDSASRLQMSVMRLSNWIGRDQNAMEWRRILMLNALETQAAKGDSADAAMLQSILVRFEMQLPGLEHPAFVDVRESLRNHTAHLIEARDFDIAGYLSGPQKDEFRAVTAAELEPYRAEVIYFLEWMKLQYARRLDVSELDSLLKELQVDEALSTLRSLDIASVLPTDSQPEISKPAEPAEDKGAVKRDSIPSTETETASNQDEVQDERQRIERRNVALRVLVAANRAFEDKQSERLDIYFSSARLALDRFVRQLAYLTDRNIKRTIQSKLQIIAENYPRLVEQNNREAIANIGDALGYLESTLQHQSLVMAIRGQFSMPNTVVTVHSDLLRNVVGRSDSQVRPVAEVILGRYIQGSALTMTSANLELIPDPHHVSASLHLNGSLSSDTFTRQGPITAYAGSNGVFEGRVNLFGNVGGFYATGPYVAANLQSYFKNVDINLRLAQRLAQKQYLRDKVRSEGIAAARAEIRIRDEFQQQTQTALRNGMANLQKNPTQLDDKRGLFPNVYAFTHSDRIEARAHKVDSFHLAAPSRPMPATVPADVHVAIHESMLVNYIDPLFVGKTLTNDEIADQVEKLFGSRPEAFTASDDEKWSITFSRVQPIRVEFEGGRVRFGVIGERFTQANNSIRTPLIIQSAFRVARDQGKLYLVRDGRTSVEFFNVERPGAKEISFKTFLERKLNETKTIEPSEEKPNSGPSAQDQDTADAQQGPEKGFELPANLIPVDKLKGPFKDSPLIRQLSLVELISENGWLSAGWKQDATGTATLTVNTPVIADYATLMEEMKKDEPAPEIENPQPDSGSDTDQGDK